MANHTNRDGIESTSVYFVCPCNGTITEIAINDFMRNNRVLTARYIIAHVIFGEVC